MLYQIGIKVLWYYTCHYEFFVAKFKFFNFPAIKTQMPKTEDQNNKELSHILRQKH